MPVGSGAMLQNAFLKAPGKAGHGVSQEGENPAGARTGVESEETGTSQTLHSWPLWIL